MQDAVGAAHSTASVTVTGTPAFLTDINDYLQGGMLILGGSRFWYDGDLVQSRSKFGGVSCRSPEWWSGSSGGSAFGFTGTKLARDDRRAADLSVSASSAIQIQNRIEEERGRALLQSVRHDTRPHGTAVGGRNDCRRHRVLDGEDLQGSDGAGLRRAAVDRHSRLAGGRCRPATTIIEARAAITNRSRSKLGGETVDRLGSLPRRVLHS